ncbi:hypothetical protein AMTR_s00113p00058000 [Amborella trichopoda]|uniref:Uncharacterized protein n=1 Tax=Amborella trichopoda TaxID=13333 RepID=W1NS95_AMBTC|nr:hypothetical protein AMTR_s00113p00058000 [Amborella trichopoda]
MASLKPNSGEGRFREAITKRGQTFRVRSPVQTVRFSLETADRGRRPWSAPTLNLVFKETGVEPTRLITEITSTPHATRDRVEDEWAYALECLANGTATEVPPLFSPALFSKTMTANREPPSQGWTFRPQ